MLDSLPLPSSPTKDKDEGAGDSSLSVSREDGELEVVAPHDIEPAASAADGGDLSAATKPVPGAKELPVALPNTTADAKQGEPDQEKASLHVEPEAQNKEPVSHEPQADVEEAEEVNQEKQSDDENEGSPLEESGSEKSDLGYTPDSRRASTALAIKEDEQEQSEGDEEKANGSSPGAANAAGASAIRRKRRLRSRRSVKCRGKSHFSSLRSLMISM
jgi:hypothetical protein